MSPIDTVSDIFAFVAKQAEFTKTILFAEDEVPEVGEKERDAMAAVMDHVRDSYVGLLDQCRKDVLGRAAGDADLTATLERNWNRPTSIWERSRVEMALLPNLSARVFFWIGDDPSRKGVLTLAAEIWAQARHREAMGRVAKAVGMTLTSGNLRLLGAELKEGAPFASLSAPLVEQLWPLMGAVRGELTAAKGRGAPKGAGES